MDSNESQHNYDTWTEQLSNKIEANKKRSQFDDLIILPGFRRFTSDEQRWKSNCNTFRLNFWSASIIHHGHLEHKVTMSTSTTTIWHEEITYKIWPWCRYFWVCFKSTDATFTFTLFCDDEIDRKGSNTSGGVMEVGFVIIVEEDSTNKDGSKTRGGSMVWGVQDNAVDSGSESDPGCSSGLMSHFALDSASNSSTSPISVLGSGSG